LLLLLLLLLSLHVAVVVVVALCDIFGYGQYSRSLCPPPRLSHARYAELNAALEDWRSRATTAESEVKALRAQLAACSCGRGSGHGTGGGDSTTAVAMELATPTIRSRGADGGVVALGAGRSATTGAAAASAGTGAGATAGAAAATATAGGTAPLARQDFTQLLGQVRQALAGRDERAIAAAVAEARRRGFWRTTRFVRPEVLPGHEAETDLISGISARRTDASGRRNSAPDVLAAASSGGSAPAGNSDDGGNVMHSVTATASSGSDVSSASSSSASAGVSGSDRQHWLSLARELELDEEQFEELMASRLAYLRALRQNYFSRAALNTQVRLLSKRSGLPIRNVTELSARDGEKKTNKQEGLFKKTRSIGIFLFQRSHRPQSSSSTYPVPRSVEALGAMEARVKAEQAKDDSKADDAGCASDNVQGLARVLAELRGNLDEEIETRGAFEDRFFEVLHPRQVATLMVKGSKVEAMSPIIVANTLHVASILG
jgi:hypothetical protein